MAFIILTGRCGSGKSSVLDIFETLGARSIKADLLAKQARSFKESEIRKYFNTLNPQELAKLIFSDPKKKELLEKITHPVIERLMQTQKNKYLSQNPNNIVIYETPLLTQSIKTESKDAIISVYCPKNIALERIIKRGIPKDLALSILNSQTSNAYLDNADYILDTNKDITDTKRDIHKLWAILCSTLI